MTNFGIWLRRLLTGGEANSPYRAQTVHPHLSLTHQIPEIRQPSVPAHLGERWLLKAVPAICTPHFAVYFARIQLPQPATAPSSGQNLPQIVTHILQKAFFKHALGVTGVQRLCIAGIPLVPVNKHRVCTWKQQNFRVRLSARSPSQRQ